MSRHSKHPPTPAVGVLHERVILITGATQGIGRAVALEYARLGATVVLLARRVPQLEAVYDEIVALAYPEPVAIPLDLLTANDADYSTVALCLRQRLGRLDGIVHCAAYLYGLSPLGDQRIDEWMHQFRINAVAPFALTRACLPLLQQSSDASVVFVGETHGLYPAPFWGGFAVSKAGLGHVMQIMACEWDAHKNLRLNLLVPGAVNSPQRQRTHPGQLASELKPIDSVLPAFVYWMSAASRGRSGEIIEL